jgi:hypothetical protein
LGVVGGLDVGWEVVLGAGHLVHYVFQVHLGRPSFDPLEIVLKMRGLEFGKPAAFRREGDTLWVVCELVVVHVVVVE